jgi:hypothetical protein
MSSLINKIEAVGGRKFVVAVFILLFSSLMYWLDHMTDENWTMLAGVVMAAFSYGNSVEHKANRREKI